jgi:hypothetical protein
VEQARVDWTAPALRVDRLVRACTPAPGAWTTFRDKRVKLGPVAVTDESLPPGEVRDGPGRHGHDRRPAGRASARGQGRDARGDWLRGLRVEPGRAVPVTPQPARRPPRSKPDRRAARPYRPPADDKPRRVAYDVLEAVRTKDAYANLVLPGLLRERGITGRDAALATELAYGALRGQGSTTR